MDERLINNASFAKICKILQKKKTLWEEVKPILQATMLIAPALINKEFVTAMALREALGQGVTWLDAGAIVGNAITSIKNLVSNQDEDFVTRAENAQIANVLLVFSAYFDTVKIFLPDKERKLYLDEVQYCLTEKSLKAYQEKLQARESEPAGAEGRKIADWDLVLPNPLEGLDAYEKRLKEFYFLLNDSFRVYIDGLSCTENLQENLRGELNRRIEMIPEAAAGNYRAQYYSLAAVCPDFFVWTNQQEHQQQRELVDRGFQSLAKEIRSIPEAINEYTANEALTALRNWYSSRLRDPIIPIKDMPPQDREMRLPTRENSFVPQAYEWLIYRERISVEATQMWQEGGEIGPDILKILRSPELGSKPILILGDPGAGKTMLCHMLAGKILCGEYHVIILHLRDLNAELSIADQIGQAIADTTDDCDCKWGTIAKANPQKPILLIFDGYDELLQASGKTYSNYLENIVAFQEKQWESRGIMVRSIVTSRIVLIDKAEIPLNSVIIRLRPFDKPRIDEWCAVWNNANEAYFEARGLNKFEVEEGSKAWDLAGEPLLLLMLALFDTKDNALRKHQNLQATELYGSLIRDFVEREKKKNQDFEGKEYKVRKKEIEKEVERIAVAALGMYNRNVLHITSGQLEDDLKFLAGVNVGGELRDSEQLLGSFFFVHDVTTRSSDVEEKEKLRAYTFLHNTFGEFLAAYYVVFQLYNLLDDLNRHIEKYEDAPFSLKERKGWYACLSYAPLFRRPVVGKMIREWAPQYFQEKKLEMEEAVGAIKELLRREIPRLLRGTAICELETVSGKFQISENNDTDLMEHLAVYTNNLVCLAALLTDGVDLAKTEEMVAGAWNKLLHLWRYTFDENEIAAFAGQFEIGVNNGTPLLIASDAEEELQRENDRITKLYKTYKNLQEEPARSILGTLLGVEAEKIRTSLSQQDLRAEAKGIFLGIVLDRVEKEQVAIRYSSKYTKMLKTYPDKCIRESDYKSLYGFFLVLNDVAAFSQEGAKYVISLLDFELLVDVYVHCSRCCTTITIPILELLNKLLPLIRDKDFHMLLDRVAVFHDFDSRLSDRSVNIWASILLQCVKRAQAGPWLNACWKLLRHVEKYFDRAAVRFSYDTIEKLGYLSIEANRNDPGFPMDFIGIARQWIDEKMCADCLPVNCVPIVEFISKIQGRNHCSECYWTTEKILNILEQENKLPDHTMLFFAKVLSRERERSDTAMWLDACWKLLRKAERYIQRRDALCREETIEKLLLLSLEAYRVDERFPLDFAYEYSMRIAERIVEKCERFAERNRNCALAYTHTDLLVLVKTIDTMLEQGYCQGRDIRKLCQSIDALLKMMQNEGVGLFDDWTEPHQFAVALCHSMQVLSEDTCMYVLTELVELIRTSKAGLSLELYRELNAIAERFDYAELRYELAQV